MDLKNVINGIGEFFSHVWNAIYHNVLFPIVTLMAYLIGYPAQKAILIATLVFFVSDFLTKLYAIRVQNKGLIKAFKNGNFSSHAFWEGFLTKIIGYFVCLTIANIAYITPQIDFIGKAIASVLYTALFFYEVISNLENLRDANFAKSFTHGLLNKFKKESQKILDIDINIDNQDNNDDSNGVR